MEMTLIEVQVKGECLSINICQNREKMKIFRNDEQTEKSDDLLAIGLRILYLFRRQRKR